MVWDDHDEDMLLAQDISVSRQFAQQWNLRAMAGEAALEDVSNSK